MGAAPAGGGSDGDYACAQVIERTTGLQCAELRGHLTPREMARTITRLSREYNGAMLAVERNNHGMAVLAYLSLAEHGRPGEHARAVPVYEQNGQAGWLTSSVSRPAMLERLGTLIEERPEILSSVQLLAECRSFVRKGDGRTEAAAGAHDDCVMAMAIAQAVRAELTEASRYRGRGA